MADPNPIPVASPAVEPMSASTRLIFTLGLAGVVLLALCCTGIGLLPFVLTPPKHGLPISDPVEVLHTGYEIVNMPVPSFFRPRGADDNRSDSLPEPATGIVLFEGRSGDGFVLLIRCRELTAEQQPKVKALADKVLQGMHTFQEPIEVLNTDSLSPENQRNRKSFTIARGMGKKSAAEQWQVEGHFVGVRSMVYLRMHVRLSRMGKDKLYRMLSQME